MVNTFIICQDWTRSAALLDYKRLGKQRVEAYQIWRLVNYLEFLGEFYLDPLPINPAERHSWVRRIAKRYNNYDYRLLYRNNTWSWISKDIKMIRPSTGEIISNNIDPNYVTLYNTSNKKSRTIDKNLVVYPDNHWITLDRSYVYHPAVLMWLGYRNALEFYIDIHIREWIRRGYQNTMPLFEPSIYVKPEWSDDSDFLIAQKSNLLRKDPAWYRQFPEFFNIADNLNYIWPCK